MTMSEVKLELITRAKRSFLEVQQDDKMGEYVVKRVSAPSDVVQLYRCGSESSAFSFHVCIMPDVLLVYGDMGEYIWTRPNTNMLNWAKGSINSIDYFSSKVPDNIVINEVYSGLVDEWYNGFPESYENYTGENWEDDMQEELDGIYRVFTGSGDINAFKNEFYESNFCDDGDNIPDCEYYTPQYLWVLEGLKWFFGQLEILS